MSEIRINLAPKTRYEVNALPHEAKEEIWTPGGYGQPSEAEAKRYLTICVDRDRDDGYTVSEGGWFREGDRWHLWWRRKYRNW